MSGTDAWQPLVRALVETILAFDDPAFPPIGVERVERRVLAGLPVEDERRPPALHLALKSFAEMGRFVVLPPSVRQAEEELLASEGAGSSEEIDGIIARKVREDARRFESFVGELGPVDRFEQAALATRRNYLRLWARSGFSERRRVYTTLKGMVLVAAYSLPELGRAVGFEGPRR
jgi:hypothetical protein